MSHSGRIVPEWGGEGLKPGRVRRAHSFIWVRERNRPTFLSTVKMLSNSPILVAALLFRFLMFWHFSIRK